MRADLCKMKISDIHQAAISVQANLRIVGARFIERLVLKKIAQQAALLQGGGSVSRSILIMAGGTGGHIFSSDITRKSRALVCTENVTGAEVING